jgi:hypothetical protein
MNNSKVGRSAATLIVAATLVGCATVEGYPKDPESASTLAALQAIYFGPQSEADYDKASGSDEASAALRQSIRNRIVLGRMRAYDIEFSRFERALSSSGNSMSAGADLAALVLNGLGATVGGVGTKSALSAASGGVIGAQGVVNKDLFYQKAVPALISQMQANRSKVKLVIYTGLEQSDRQYPLQRADSDLANLNDAGSIPNAIGNITQSSKAEESDTEKEIENRSFGYSTSPSAIAIRAWLAPNKKVDATHFKALSDWLANNKDVSLRNLNPAELATLGSTSDPALADKLEQARQSALADPTLDIPQ